VEAEDQLSAEADDNVTATEDEETHTAQVELLTSGAGGIYEDEVVVLLETGGMYTEVEVVHGTHSVL